MGDDPPQLGSQTRDIFKNLERYAPDAIAAIAGTLPKTSQAQLAAEQTVEPGYENLYRANQLNAAQTEADVVNGPGASLVSAADKYQRQLDPEYYSGRGLVSDALKTYLSSYDPTKLTPTEEAQISRGIGATGGNLTPSAMQTIRNAQTFGSAGTERWKNFGEAVSRAASAIPSLKSGISGFDVARTRGTDTGARQASQNALGSNFGFSNNALSNITSTNTQREQKRKDLWDQILAGVQAYQGVGQGTKSFTDAGMNIAAMAAASDRNAKGNIETLDPVEVLQKLLKIPISRWTYNSDPTTPHYGAMAQDFQKEFNLGDGKSIAFVDAIGVLMAAVQGLYKLQTK